jgi:hypothetical protein
MKLTTQQIDWLNIAFMIASAAAAYVLPFEVFLFAYAVLGPLHYLTEISWLHQRNYFASGKYDFMWLLVLGFVLFAVAFLVPWQEITPGRSMVRVWTAGLAYVAFLSALAMTVCRTPGSKLLCISAGLIFLLLIMNWPAYTIVFGVFLLTLIHVYVFTGLFMLYGALKSGSRPGLLALAVFIACPVVLVLLQWDTGYSVSEYAQRTYPLFHELNAVIYGLLGFPAKDQTELHAAMYGSAAGLAIMRCIAFAYTYHYLNWFAKTSIIKWHQVSRQRLAAITAAWLLAVGVYFYDFRVGFIALATLSFLHVFLEFPLNHRTIIGIASELRSRLRPAQSPAPEPPPVARKHSRRVVERAR